MNDKVFEFKISEIENSLEQCLSKGITELSVHDNSLAGDKERVLRFFSKVQSVAPDLFVSVKINPKIIDNQLCQAAQNINCSLELDFKASEKGFDKKLLSKKCALLNNAGLVFGVQLYYADTQKDTLKLFKDRIDFAVAQYPNHIDFPQTENSDESALAKVTGIFSGQDIRYARNLAFACRTFYSAGRAVPWFVSVLAALKITASSFFADFSEWQKVNNCDYKSGFAPENVKHEEIEKMQLIFLTMKLEEKHTPNLLPLVTDIVQLNGAFSRLVSDGTQSTVMTQYDPEDLLGPESMNLVAFEKDVCMEKCAVNVFLNEYGEVDFRCLQ